ncbi:MAG: pyruvate kinase [Xanthomonadaceae bacterium]|nr:pyruvate kinase [Xanthomonadaceae bacterium]
MPNISQFRRVKIVCTLGPSSNSAPMMRSLIDAGLDVARFNFSHGTHDVHESTFKTLREQAKKSGRAVASMQDLQGPKIRLGKLPATGIEIKAGDTILLYPEGASVKTSQTGKRLIPVSTEICGPISKALKKGAMILFDDGKYSAEVKSVNPPEIVAEVKVGGKLSSNKGMNLPGSTLPIASVTEKDYEDLKFGLKLGMDAIALSFVRSPKDIEEVKNFIRKTSNHKPMVIAKIEREEAVNVMEQIVDVTDGVLVARGDMAVEIGAERVPIVQKQLIRVCNEVGVPVITATQMLESMISNPTPTRAEANDVANAVFDGTDAVMLSAETASGQYPLEAVAMMSKVILEAEQFRRQYSRSPDLVPMTGSVVESIEFSASRIADHVGAASIACMTHSGVAARSLSKFRPLRPIVAITDNEEAMRKLAFVWGVQSVLIPDIVSTEDVFETVEKVMKSHKWAEIDDYVVVTAGIPTLRRGTTNMIKVHKMGSLMERAARSVKTKTASRKA